MFNIDNLVINRPVRGTFFDGATSDVLVSIDQITEASLECSGEQVYVNDAIGQKIASFDRSKDATFTCTNALINFGLMAAQFGSDKKVASAEDKIIVPAFELIEVKGAADTITLQHTPASDVKYIYATNKDKSRSVKYEVATAASETAFSISDKTITLPTGKFSVGDRVAVWYDRESENAMELTNSTTKFAKSGRFVLEALGCDICDQSTEYYIYIIFNNSKLDNNVTVDFSNEANHQFTVNALQDYCSIDNKLFSIVVAE